MSRVTAVHWLCHVNLTAFQCRAGAADYRLHTVQELMRVPTQEVAQGQVPGSFFSVAFVQNKMGSPCLCTIVFVVCFLGF